MSSSPIPVANRFLFPINVNQREMLPNQFNRCLWQEEKVWKAINNSGGLNKLCAGLKYHDPPWLKMPAQGKSLREISSIPVPAADGLDHVVLSFLVPNGFDGVGLTLIQNYTGQGFAEGSGDLTWRILLNMRYPKTLGNMQTSMGSFTIPYPQGGAGPLLLQSDQLVQYIVNRSTTSNLNGGRIICAIWGYWYPRGVHVP